MIQSLSIEDIETAVNQYGEVVIKKIIKTML